MAAGVCLFTGAGIWVFFYTIAWVLRDPRVTSALIGARTVAQIDDSLDAVNNLDFSAEELAAIDAAAPDGAINIWSDSSDIRELPAAQERPA
jgi:L-glyceraldehyde 3-phosphate reductase